MGPKESDSKYSPAFKSMFSEARVGLLGLLPDRLGEHVQITWQQLADGSLCVSVHLSCFMNIHRQDAWADMYEHTHTRARAAHTMLFEAPGSRCTVGPQRSAGGGAKV